MKTPKPWSFNGISDDYANALAARATRQEKALIKAVVRAIKRADAHRYDADQPIESAGYREGLKAIDGFEIAAINDAENNKTAKLIEGHLKKLSDHNQRGFEEQWHTVFGINPLEGDDGRLKATLADTLNTSVNKIKTLDKQHFTALRNILAKGYIDGSTTDDLEKVIAKQFGVTRWRARFYAVNEMGNLNAALTEHRQTEAGVKRYIWRTSQDERVRPSHIVKEGETFSWDDPPDDTGHPGRDYRCRCTAEPILDDADLPDENEFWNLFEPEQEQDPEPVEIPFFAKVKDLRTRLGISQDQIATDLGKSRGWVSGFETGRNSAKKDLGRMRGYLQAKGALPDELDRIFGTIEAEPWLGAIEKKVKAKAKEVAIASTEFPEDLSALVDVKGLGGSTGARLVEDPITKKRFVLKRGANAEHLREEFLTNEIYRALGVKVPNSKLYNGNTTLAEFIEGKTISDLSGNARKQAMEKASQSFAADALVANWDVAGLSLDNMLVDAAGDVWRIDNGAGLRYRAQGGPKGGAFNRYVSELWSLRNKSMNASAAEVFGELDFDQIAGQIENVVKNRAAVEALIDDAILKNTVTGRLDYLEEISELARDMREDGWNVGYADNFAKHRALMAQDGILFELPDELKPGHRSGAGDWSNQELLWSGNESALADGLIVRDENGDLFDNLRGEDGIMMNYFNYLDSIAGDKNYTKHLAKLHMDWAKEQAGDSWNHKAQAVKSWIAENRSDANAHYWFRDGAEKAESRLNDFVNSLPATPSNYGNKKTKREMFDETMTAFHALNYDILKKAKLPTKTLDNKSIVVVRTENSDVLDRYNARSVDHEGHVIRGPLESTSLFRTYYFLGNNVVWTEVKLHRVFASYLPDRGSAAFMKKFSEHSGHYGSNMLLGDHENEAVVIMENSRNKVMRANGSTSTVAKWESDMGKFDLEIPVPDPSEPDGYRIERRKQKR